MSAEVGTRMIFGCRDGLGTTGASFLSLVEALPALSGIGILGFSSG